MNLATKSKDKMLTLLFIIVWIIPTGLSLFSLKMNLIIVFLLLQYLGLFLWFMKQFYAADDKIKGFKEEDNTEVGASFWGNFNGSFIFGFFILSLGLSIGGDNFLGRFFAIEVSPVNEFTVLASGFVLSGFLLALFSASNPARVLFTPFATVALLCFIVNPMIVAIHKVEILIYSTVFAAVLVTSTSLSFRNWAEQGYSKLQFYKRYSYLVVLFMLLELAGLSYLSLDPERGLAVVIGCFFGGVVGFVCVGFASIFATKKAKKIKKVKGKFVHIVKHYPLLYLLSMPIAFPITLLFHFLPALGWKVQLVFNKICETIETHFSQSAKPYLMLLYKGNSPVYLYWSIFLFPLIPFALFQWVVTVYSPTLGILFFMVGVYLFLFFSLFIPLLLAVYNRLVFPIIQASGPEKETFALLHHFPNVYCSHHMIRPIKEKKALFYHQINCPYPDCGKEVDLQNNIEEPFLSGKLTGLIGGDEEKLINNKGFLGFTDSKLFTKNVADKNSHYKPIYPDEKSLLNEISSQTSQTQIEGEGTKNDISRVIPLWSEKDKKARNAWINELIILESTTIESFDWAVSSVILESANDLLKPRDYLKQVRVTVFGNPPLSENSYRLLQQECKEVIFC